MLAIDAKLVPGEDRYEVYTHGGRRPTGIDAIEWAQRGIELGAGELRHLAEVIEKGRADAVLAAGIFHFGKYTVADAKEYLRSRGIPVRL